MRGVQLAQVLMRPIHHENVERQSRGSVLARRPALRFESGSAVARCGTRVVVGSRASEGVNYPTACSLAAPVHCSSGGSSSTWRTPPGFGPHAGGGGGESACVGGKPAWLSFPPRGVHAAAEYFSLSVAVSHTRMG